MNLNQRSMSADRMGTVVNGQLSDVDKIDYDGSDISRSHRSASIRARYLVGQSSSKTKRHIDIDKTDALYDVNPKLILATVRKNREIRDSGHTRVKKNKERNEELGIVDDVGQTCPICNKVLFGGDRDVNEHIDRCLTHPAEVPSNSDSIDNPCEVYEWAGQTRIRTVSLMEGGIVAALGKSVSNRQETKLGDEEIELDIENDETLKYGPSQYSDNCLKGTAIKPDNPENIPTDHILPGAPRDMLVSALKAKIRQQEDLVKLAPKCLICLEVYKIPVVSVNCWHVYCESCWLDTLSAKKLCPQCNVIVTPFDLRKVYL